MNTPARIAVALFLVAAGACAVEAPPSRTAAGAAAEKAAGTAARGWVRVIAVHPHDPAAFTQGLLWHQGRLYESVGQYGQSALREVEIESGRVVRQVRLGPREFGEGLARIENRLFQLTWREGLVKVWGRDDFKLLAEHTFAGEGWGLTSDGKRLIQSDGSSALIFRSPTDLSILGRVRASRAGAPVHYLNELEWAQGAIYANIWMSDEIVRIDPESGEVTAVFDASALLDAATRARVDVLNGIAWNPERKVFYLTGKNWPRLFEVELVPGER